MGVVQSSSGSEVFFTHYSPTLARISVLMNSYSINLYAETLKLEAEKELAKNRPISISRYWYEILNLQGFRLYDGSGLSRYSRVTPDNTIKLLSYMYSSEYAKDYYESLAVAGQLPGEHPKTMGSTSSRSCLANPVVALFFEFQSKRFVARACNATLGEDVHIIRFNVVQQTLVMRNQHDGPVW